MGWPIFIAGIFQPQIFGTAPERPSGVQFELPLLNIHCVSFHRKVHKQSFEFDKWNNLALQDRFIIEAKSAPW